MEGTLLVTPEELKSTASEFSADGTSVKSITSEMMNLINELASNYEGDAATAYINNFKKLQDDMNQIDQKIQEHVSDLNEMADNYQRTESMLTEQNAAVNNNYIP